MLAGLGGGSGPGGLRWSLCGRGRRSGFGPGWLLFGGG